MPFLDEVLFHFSAVTDSLLFLVTKLPFYDLVYDVVTDFITEHRGWFVIFFVLPLSLLFDIFFAIRGMIVMKFYSAPQLHEERVKDIQSQIKAWNECGAKTKLCTARGGWQSISPGNRAYKKSIHSTQIAVNLYDILEFDEKAMTIRVEPMVNMGQISHYLIAKGYTIPILPEMDDLTVGGLMMGVGIECSSHKYGLFNDTVEELEIVLADGSVMTCSKTENREMFDALPWSYGTLGFLTAVTIRVMKCKPFVRLEYFPCYTKESGAEMFKKLSCGTSGKQEDVPDLVESLAYSEHEQVVMSGTYVDAEDVVYAQKDSIGLWYKPWFYKHVQSKLTKDKDTTSTVSYIPLRDYYHRHTKAIFWELEQIIPIGNHPLFRLLLGWAVPPKVSFLKITQTEKIIELYEKQHVIQDMLVPISRLSEALDVFKKEYDLYPLWICPYKAYDYTDLKGDASQSSAHRCFLRKPDSLTDPVIDEEGYREENKWEMYVDIGAYGIPQAVLDKKPFDAVKTGRAVEAYVARVKGFQMLYADSYMNRDEFREMFDHSHYDQMKLKYDPKGAFPEIYQKVCRRGQALWGSELKESKKAQ
uniref:Delta(24)-sterol reductase n=1 Tax=Corethron hystrix TaxID=216773 RepID=A0A7S1B9R5_9STRA|mmetsp:Transcript_16895/g.38011  ORF Transcript_16895/g.38011 Transcript_16895/m.38011 type:complete len:587 (+) Transcript_16895:219-1979(+)|eukprot:CAMPEP_0113312480 /NCGR_PEP_ID=MMETSP0010_2-20120614/9304_1 /TAXON_ID=216773 ORGANISM="Corethron hystrix, Strain 308" /NCGR_SAMPLE_ID=MMETSP0010_2 /ASSEMBLY_ACC=CAM_ASM_000155 /LENGTH=586 /DNA_ID=CAMNT_0000168335 /DNA_START=151 /DNA_END=1911 /DNA_ORIENTATION=+ /assembly_acc=CAM_ASM_000155